MSQMRFGRRVARPLSAEERGCVRAVSRDASEPPHYDTDGFAEHLSPCPGPQRQS